MGGSGSGRWGNHTPKTLIEDCRILNIKRFTHDKTLRLNTYRSGRLLWLTRLWAHIVESIEYEIDMRDNNNLWLQLSYTLTRPRKCITSRIALEVTQLYHGGLRWWLKCPLRVNGSPCNRRMQKLYRPPGEEYFGCRQCWNLTYKSCQENHVFDRLDAEIGARYPLARVTGAGA